VGKKWYSYFVVTEEKAPTAGSPSADAPVPARRVVDVVPDADGEAAIEPPAATPTDLVVVYESAKITTPPHGYTVLKVAEMLESEHIKTLPADVKRKSLLVALDAAGVRVDEIVEDAVRRDRALDTYERVLEKHLEGLRAHTAAENQTIEEEMARRLAELRARVDENRRKIEIEEREFLAWRSRKHQEEETIARAVGYFVSENPITMPAGHEPAEGDH
jgi:hypothetical protein